MADIFTGTTTKIITTTRLQKLNNKQKTSYHIQYILHGPPGQMQDI